MSAESPTKQGDALLPKFVYHIYLVAAALVILLACAASRKDHHHHAGIGLGMVLVVYAGTIIGTALYQKSRKGQLYDRSAAATRLWKRLVWGGVPAVFILSCLIGFAAGTAVTIASLAYLVVMVFETIAARPRQAPERTAPTD